MIHPSQIESKVDRFILANSETRKLMISDIEESVEGLWPYIQFMSYAAVNSVRQKSSSLLVKGLYANILEAVRYDSRDNIVALTKLYHSAEILGMDPKVEFKNVANDTEGKGKELLLSFINRAPSNRTLECMGLKIATEPEFDYT